MKKLTIIMALVGILIAWLNVNAWSAQQKKGWTYLGDHGIYNIYRKTGTTDEFMIYNENRTTIFIKELRGGFKMSLDGDIFECERGGRSDYPQRYYCHLIINGVDKFQQCNDNNNDVSDDFLFNERKKMCARNWGKTISYDTGKAIDFAMTAKVEAVAPDWDEEERKAKKAEQEEVYKIQQEIKDRKQQKYYESVKTQKQESITQNNNKMEVIEGAAGCSIVITNNTVYNFTIKINNINYGILPQRGMARIKGVNCNGFMIEAIPDGIASINSSISRAFQYNQKDSNNIFHWNLRYRKK
jgi:hypothetical protein